MVATRYTHWAFPRKEAIPFQEYPHGRPQQTQCSARDKSPISVLVELAEASLREDIGAPPSRSGTPKRPMRSASVISMTTPQRDRGAMTPPPSTRSARHDGYIMQPEPVSFLDSDSYALSSTLYSHGSHRNTVHHPSASPWDELRHSASPWTSMASALDASELRSEDSVWDEAAGFTQQLEPTSSISEAASLSRDLDWFALRLALRDLNHTVSRLGHTGPASACAGTEQNAHTLHGGAAKSTSLTGDSCSSISPSAACHGGHVDTGAELLTHHASHVWHVRRCSWPKSSLGLQDGLYILPAGPDAGECRGSSCANFDWRNDVHQPSVAWRMQGMRKPHTHRKSTVEQAHSHHSCTPRSQHHGPAMSETCCTPSTALPQEPLESCMSAGLIIPPPQSWTLQPPSAAVEGSARAMTASSTSSSKSSSGSSSGSSSMQARNAVGPGKVRPPLSASSSGASSDRSSNSSSSSSNSSHPQPRLGQVGEVATPRLGQAYAGSSRASTSESDAGSNSSVTSSL
mmetsp:Transcript_32184/g.71169  ORF Transcript_32184/g.71169 Transcript_32184/m.71169 type:complete len:516 (-) Transcript_32184:8-1555(-)